MRSDREVVVVSEWSKDFGRFGNLLRAREQPVDKPPDTGAVLTKPLQLVRDA